MKPLNARYLLYEGESFLFFLNKNPQILKYSMSQVMNLSSESKNMKKNTLYIMVPVS